MYNALLSLILVLFLRVKLSTEYCHLIRPSHQLDYKYGNAVNYGNFTRAVQRHCKNLYNKDTEEAYVKKCINEAGPPFIKQQKATVSDVQGEGSKLVQRAKICANNMRERYQRLKQLIQQKCSNIH